MVAVQATIGQPKHGRLCLLFHVVHGGTRGASGDGCWLLFIFFCNTTTFHSSFTLF
jgi:hypothetical protein